MPPAHHRDAGLRRVRTTTRMLAVGSIAVAGALSLLVAHDHPGASRPHAAPGSPSPTTPSPVAPRAAPASGATTSPAAGTSATTAARGLTPTPAPTATTQPPVTSSGAS